MTIDFNEATAPNLLAVRHLSKEYDGFRLDDVSLSVPAGCVVGLVGANGSGKTTTIKTLLGVSRPSGGTVELFGERVDACAEGAARAHGRVGVVFDTCPFPGESRVADVAGVGRAAFRTWDNRAFERYLGLFGLEAKKRVKKLSRGMGMKLQLAFALAHAPELLILDEATAGLDPLARGEVLDLLRTFMEDERHGILMSSHITTDLEQVADYVVCIDAGRVVFARSVEEICDQAGVVRCRAEQAHELMVSGLFEPNALYVMSGACETTVLVPDRLALKQRFPGLLCERATIETYLTLMLKGDQR